MNNLENEKLERMADMILAISHDREKLKQALNDMAIVSIVGAMEEAAALADDCSKVCASLEDPMGQCALEGFAQTVRSTNKEYLKHNNMPVELILNAKRSAIKRQREQEAAENGNQSEEFNFAKWMGMKH